MDFRLGANAEHLRDALVEFLEEELTDELEEHIYRTGVSHHADFVQGLQDVAEAKKIQRVEQEAARLRREEEQRLEAKRRARRWLEERGRRGMRSGWIRFRRQSPDNPTKSPSCRVARGRLDQRRPRAGTMSSHSGVPPVGATPYR